MTAAALTMSASLLLGLVASSHCLVMCGGITTALGMATARRDDGRARIVLLCGYQVGRIASYALAGALFGGIGHAAISLLDQASVRIALRGGTALALLIAALVAFGTWRDPGSRLGRFVWPRIAPLGRRLLPVATLPRALAFGMLWGWMPCGLVYTVLLIATLSLDSWGGAATMAAFGVGTAPALLASALCADRVAHFFRARKVRSMAGIVLLASAALTLAGPWLAATQMHWLQAWLPYECAER